MAVLRDNTDRERLQKTLELLNKAAFCIQKSRTQEEIFAVTAEKLKQLNFHAIFWLLNEERSAGRIVQTTAGKHFKNLKTADGTPVSELEFPISGKLYENSIKKMKTTYIEEVKAAIKQVPPDLHIISEKVISFLDVTNKRAVVAPLIVHNDTVGLLAVISDTVSQDDIPSVHAFANQVSTALENAWLHEERQKRTEELTKKLKEQEVLRELTTKLFLAQSRDEVLDAAIEGIHALGESFSAISLLNDERTHSAIVRFKLEPTFLTTVEKIAGRVLPGFTMLGYHIPVWEEDNIYCTFFKNNIPLVTSNIIVDEPVMKADMSEFYAGLAPKEQIYQSATKAIAKLLPHKSVMIFPIRCESTTIGTLTVASKEVFSQDDFELMKTVGEMISGAMERVVQSEKLTETLHELRAVQRINTLLNMGASLEEILTHVCSSIKEVYHYQFAFPVLLDPSRKYLTFTYVSVPPEMTKKMHKMLGVDIRDFTYAVTEDFSLFQIIEEKKWLILKGFEELADIMPADEFRSIVKALSSDLSKGLGLEPGEDYLMVAPLPYGKEIIGVLFLGHRKLLTERDFQQLEYFLDQVGIAIAKSDTELKLRQSLKELRELDQMKSEFIDIASHELRTPLTTLRLYLEMMVLEQYGKLSEPLKKRIRIMEDGVSRLEEIINQTLVASRIIKDKLELEKRPVSLLEIAADVVNQLRPLWKAKNQNVFIESPSGLSFVEGDKKALFTVLSSLVDNAIRYSQKDTEILIKFVEHPEEVECMVIDQGCGIAPEHMEKIFDEFYIIPSETEYARMDGRTGLGLFIAEGIMKQHGGKIWVESTPYEGSTFHFALVKSRYR
ncbi:MAG: hypothetical protein AYK19_04175 [Theionarchaea archaeon DG-70-1]|nr:MAG: hypothetical protein AYK19_04175 [Theionarchaea archaeon DG-70-1]